jgi:hypothetical protein
MAMDEDETTTNSDTLTQSTPATEDRDEDTDQAD